MLCKSDKPSIIIIIICLYEIAASSDSGIVCLRAEIDSRVQTRNKNRYIFVYSAVYLPRDWANLALYRDVWRGGGQPVLSFEQ